MYFFGDTYFESSIFKTIFQIIFSLVLVTEVVILILSARCRHKHRGTGQDHGSMLLVIIGFWAAIAVNPVCVRLFPWILPDGFFWTGMGMAALGVVIRVTAVHRLGEFFTLSVQTNEKQAIVNTGIYKLLRHPAYAGSVLTLWGISLAFRSPVGLAAVLVITAAIYGYRITIEEKTMENVFGEAYCEYEKKTWRLIPFIW